MATDKKKIKEGIGRIDEAKHVIEAAPKLVGLASKLNAFLTHSSPALETIGHVFPPIRLALDTLLMGLDIANIGFVQKTNIPSRVLRIGLSVAAIALIVAAFIAPPVAGTLIAITAGLALAKQAIRLGESIYNLYQKAKEINAVRVEQNSLEKNMEQALKNDPNHFLTALELEKLHHGHLPQEISKSLYRMIQRNANDPIFKELKQKLDLNDPLIDDLKNDAPKINYREMIGHFVQQEKKLVLKEKEYQQLSRKTLQTAIQFGFGITALVGTVLLFTPLAPVGLGLLGLTILGGIAHTIGFALYDRAQKKQELKQPEIIEDTSLKTMLELKEHSHPEKIMKESVEKVVVQEKIVQEKINITPVKLDDIEDESEGEKGDPPHLR